MEFKKIQLNGFKSFAEKTSFIIEKSDFNLDVDVCLSNKEAEDHILEDRIEGAKKFKIDATPTLIINGKKFDNPSNYKKLKKFIEKLI